MRYVVLTASRGSALNLAKGLRPLETNDRLRRVIRGALAILAALISTAAIAQDYAVQPFVRGSWQHITARHAGTPYVVHLWGLTCGPCRVEMPEWGKLLSERKDLTLVTIHAERVPPDATLVTQMLAESGLAHAESWFFDERFLEPLRLEIAPAWHGELPRTILMNGDGTARSIVGSADMSEIASWLDAQKSKPTMRQTAPAETRR